MPDQVLSIINTLEDDSPSLWNFPNPSSAVKKANYSNYSMLRIEQCVFLHYISIILGLFGSITLIL